LNIEVRPGVPLDLPAIAQIQAASPQASQWDPVEYLGYHLLVALAEGRLAAFAVTRRLAPDERELLNLAVDPPFRRFGIGRRLLGALTSGYPGVLWLEVRESNAVARSFYKSLGFCDAGRRSAYYLPSGETAIVMKLHS
jgi:ribosomal-protein-alanine N-acetyltransferase